MRRFARQKRSTFLPFTLKKPTFPPKSGTMSNFWIKLRYRGRLRNPEDVALLADEVEDICRSRNWKYHLWEEDWSKPASVDLYNDDGVLIAEGHAPLQGITFQPHSECETIWLTFTPDGILQSLFTLNDPTWTADDATYPWSRVKTGFDGAVTHLAICQLFFYLAEKYFDHFECSDESAYWKHRDDARLETWLNEAAAQYELMQQEIAALEANESLEPSIRDEIFYNLIKAYGNRFRRQEE